MNNAGPLFLGTPMEPDDETAVSEITIQPDGRVFVLGASRQVLEILGVLNPEDVMLQRRLQCAKNEDSRAKLEGNAT